MRTDRGKLTGAALVVALALVGCTGPGQHAESTTVDETTTATSNATSVDVPADATSSANEGISATEFATVLNGIDISKYEPDYAAETVPADFVILRASRGLNEVDATVAAKYQLAKDAGRLLGLYHYSDADFGNDPVAEADAFVAVARDLDAIGEAILVLDHEAESQAAGGAEWALKFLDRVKETTGVTPLIYGSAGIICNPSYAEVAADYALWVARYSWGWEPLEGYYPDADPGSVAPWSAATIYQYTAMGFLPGLDEELDVDVFYGNANDWHNLAAVQH